MKFLIKRIKNDNGKNINSINFFHEEESFSGVRKIADKVRNDVSRVVGALPTESYYKENMGKYPVIYGTVGHSPILEDLNRRNLIDLSVLHKKRESYIFKLIESPYPGVICALVIAGSDKRGTIYGLFHLSEIIGVSPLVDWSDVKPITKDEVVLTNESNMISKEPSVKYRGFFINDEWPSFGNWAVKHFGGLNAAMYEHVFELLLRLKGNYLWPAMWHSNFSMDGPGLLSAELADEYGIVLGTSHHEPCIRNGEEYSLLRGSNSIYGDDWNYITNRDGILKFWEDGLKRNGKFENIITMGMRGERDSAILDPKSTLKENIDLLSDILKEQNKLIKENVNYNLDEVKRLFVLFTEVESFFYGDKDIKGLIEDRELDNVTIMLSDDNYGNLRSLPDDNMRKHKGGYGLYYHLDFHGGAYAYDWMNTNYLPKMWEQLSMSYDYGIRDVWIANVGDISLLEYPLSYFLDMAYDIEKYGTNSPNNTEEYTRQWIDNQFGACFLAEDRNIIYDILTGYTKLNHNRKPEIMSSKVYHPVHYKEADDVLKQTEEIIEKAEYLKNKCSEEYLPQYIELVYFPAYATCNVQQMQIYASKNEFYAKQGRVEANDYADKIAYCIEKDRALTDEFHNVDDKKWYGMGLSEHIGFVNWNEEGCKYPLMIRIEPANKPRIIVAPSTSTKYTEGGEWTGKDILIDDFMNQDVNEVDIDIACGSKMPVQYNAYTDCEWINLSRTCGCVDKKDILKLTINRNMIHGKQTGEVLITAKDSNIKIIVEAENVNPDNIESMTFLESQGYISIEAEHYSKTHDVNGIGFRKLNDYGRTLSAMKVLPPVSDFLKKEDRPFIEYSFIANSQGLYNLDLYLSPSNPTYIDGKLYLGIQINEDDIKTCNAVSSKFKTIDFRSIEWVKAVLDNIRIYKNSVMCKKGINKLRIYSISPSLVLEKIVLYPKDTELPESYLGPTESFYKK